MCVVLYCILNMFIYQNTVHVAQHHQICNDSVFIHACCLLYIEYVEFIYQNSEQIHLALSVIIIDRAVIVCDFLLAILFGKY